MFIYLYLSFIEAKLAAQIATGEMTLTAESVATQLENTEKDKQLVVLGQTGSYHGDTLGNMVLSPASVYNTNTQHPWYETRVVSLSLPYVNFQRGVLGIDARSMPAKVCIRFLDCI